MNHMPTCPSLHAAIRDKAILRSTPRQRLVAPDGRSNTWLIDLRPIFMDASTLDTSAELFWQTCEHLMPFQVGGMETAAIPLLSAILMKSRSRGRPITGFIVRKERKTHGTGNLVEGHISDLPIIIVDDVINAGTSLEKVRTVLSHVEKSISSVFVLIDYRSPGGLSWREKNEVPVLAPYLLSDFGITPTYRGESKHLGGFDEQWRFASPKPSHFHRVPKSFPATDGKRLFFGSDSGIFWCLDAVSGKPVWAASIEPSGAKNIWSAPALAAGRVYFGAYDGNVYCLDAETGKEVWRNIGADWVGSSPVIAEDLGLLFIGMEFATEGQRGSVAALDIASGETRWEFKTRRFTHASPAYWQERGVVACGSNDDEMLLLNAESGELLWRFKTDSRVTKGSIRHAPAFDRQRGYLVTGCANGSIYVIDVQTGRPVWSVETGNTIYTVPLVVGRLAYIGSTDKYLYVLDLETLSLKKRLFLSSKIFSPPALIDGRVYVGGCDGVLYEIDDRLEISARHQLKDAITNRVAYSAETGLFYVLTYMNELHALRRVRSA